MKAGGLRFAVVVARYNEIVTKLLLEGALDTFRRYSVNEEDIDIKGDTSHYDAIVNSATSGVLLAGLYSGVPCIFGVLTCDDMDEALNRAGGKPGNKGSEIALTALWKEVKISRIYSLDGDMEIELLEHTWRRLPTGRIEEQQKKKKRSEFTTPRHCHRDPAMTLS